MCIGEPMQVIDREPAGARCRDRFGDVHLIDLMLVGEPPAGAWLLVFLNVAREVIDAARAAAMADALAAVDAVMRGDVPDVEAAFADLIDREPQLPDFLNGA
ncbi:HypC/HybG/HupF family hydrogenase formation chaperone [Nitrogeniibacter mangrovi]|uniref:HypC/HybG/HupF family hydrogenase formation chaperone n=1 Tax=Nitrogeniibacter mangrovi TaxID=2016596 RepID=A0A6C1AZS0_9RHOO|nr:HypC/HybG/HupF family hydrogenase formation chaperone [Nitrogeniibacter mangrovi]QID16856.1 HypC/HybG/HupF family hydrogenase formation chaperone [Nitrogeniibacter mangrovi]